MSSHSSPTNYQDSERTIVVAVPSPEHQTITFVFSHAAPNDMAVTVTHPNIAEDEYGTGTVTDGDTLVELESISV